MKALTTLLPVFTMIVLGMIARKKKWPHEAQAKGAKNLVFNVLFPVMIFSILFSSSLPSESLSVIGYVTIAFIFCYRIGMLIRNWIGREYYTILVVFAA